jgi:hypothetical protein
MLENEDLPKIIKKIAQMERLKNKAKLFGVTVKIVNKNMTTQRCGKCPSTYKFKGEIYECTKCYVKRYKFSKKYLHKRDR